MADVKQFLRDLYPFVESVVGEQIGEKLKEGGRQAVDYGRGLTKPTPSLYHTNPRTERPVQDVFGVPVEKSWITDPKTGKRILQTPYDEGLPGIAGPPLGYGEEVDVGAALTSRGGVSTIPKSTPAPEKGLQSRHNVGRAEAVKRALGASLDRIHADYGIKGTDATTMLHNFADSQIGRRISEGLLNKGEDEGVGEEYRRFLKANSNADRPS